MLDATAAPDAKPILFLWGQFGPYHVDRCTAAATTCPNHAIVGIEVANASEHHYNWEASEAVGFSKRTLFPGKSYEKAGRLRRLIAMLRDGVGVGARHNFLCHYDQPEVFVLAIVLRLFGRRVFMMWESKFDDHPRNVWRELLKWFLLLPYNGAITSGPRARTYLYFLGLTGRPVAEGYDSISVERLRNLAGTAPAPDGIPFAERHFIVVARLVEKKNLPLALAAYDLYRRRAADRARKLIVLGTGPLESALKAEVAARGLDGVEFPGFVQAEEVARHMGRALALILPSNEEQWGLVVNEALALGVPVLCSENVGARDTLVREGVNGHVFKGGEAERLAALMDRLATDEVYWRKLASSAASAAPLGDAARFGEGVRTLIAFHP